MKSYLWFIVVILLYCLWIVAMIFNPRGYEFESDQQRIRREGAAWCEFHGMTYKPGGLNYAEYRCIDEERQVHTFLFPEDLE